MPADAGLPSPWTLAARAEDAGLFRRNRLRVPIHRHIVRLCRHAIEPGADLRKGGEIVIAEMRDMGIGIKRDVGDGVAVCGEEAMMLEVILHHGERAVAFLHPILERVLLQLASAL